MSAPSLSANMIEFWKSDADPFVSSLFGVQNPGTLIMMIAGISILIKRNERLSQHEKEPSYIKPVLLVLYGLLFGVSGAGCMLAYAATDRANDCFRCVDRQVLSILTVSMRYLGYAYVCTLIFEFWMLSLESAQGQIQSPLKMARHIIWIMMTFIALKYLPVGYYAFCPLMHCVQRTLTFGTCVLESASAELNFVSKTWRSKVKVLESACWAIIMAQQMWVYTVLQCELSILNLMGATAAAFNAITILME